jgi:predicted O-methyltransferase YrrM
MASDKRSTCERLWSEVDAFLSAKLNTSDLVLETALRNSDRAGLPAIQVTANEGRMLQLLAEAQGAKRILEIGTLGGYSTICLARALPNDGFLLSLELEPKYAAVARKNIERAGLNKLVKIKVGDAGVLLAQLIAKGNERFDLIFIDADKARYPEYFKKSMELCRPGTLIVADNIVRKGAVIEADNADPNVQGVRRLLDLIAAEPNVSATAIQSVGSKGYDGFILARVSKPRRTNRVET